MNEILSFVGQNIFGTTFTIQKVLAEFFGTAILVLLGNGAVANVELKGTKSGQSNGHAGWVLIALGYGFAVMFPVLMFGAISAQINPGFTIGLAVNGMMPWSIVPIYVLAQLLGAMAGQLCVVAMYKRFYDKTESAAHILGTFCTTSAIPVEEEKIPVTGFVTEFIGSFLLFFLAIGIVKGTLVGESTQIHGLGLLALGWLVCALVVSVGGPTGPALNPARDLGPRILHQILPLKHKGSSRWDYSWVPVVAPISAGILAVSVYNSLFAGI